jgi:hypothetical protein
MFTIELSAGTDASRWPLGIPRPYIGSILRDSGPIVPSPYSRPQDVSLPAGISAVNRSSNVEGFTEITIDSAYRSEIYLSAKTKIALSTRCISRDSLDMSSVHITAKRYWFAIEILTLGFQSFIKNNIQNFAQTHNVAMH